MICINCGAKLRDDVKMNHCPNCGASLNNGSEVTGDTKVNMKLFEEDHDKTVILPDFGEGMPVPDTSGGPAATTMKTNPQMEFTPEDFEQYGNFDADGSNPYGIEMPGTPPKTEKNVSAFPPYSEATVVLPHSHGEEQDGEGDFQDDERNFRDSAEDFRGDAGNFRGRQEDFSDRREYARERSFSQPAREKAPEKEKYFPNGFLQEHPDIRPKQRKHRIGVLDVLVLLLGLATLGVCVVIFRRSDGLSLIRQFIGGDMDLIMANIDDITYFVNNLDVTWRLYYEVAALVMLAIITVVVFVILHCFVKSQVLSILKAVLLLATGVGMVILCVGYGLYYLITVGGGSFLIDGGGAGIASAGMAAAGGVAVIIAGILWLVYMLLWGFTSFFRGFHVASMALLSLGFVFAFLLMLLNLVITWKSCHAVMPQDALYELMSTPAMIAMFMVLSVLASLEDFLAKRAE